ncbi:PilZ domain-containing protein [Aliiglaciecola litoralis]|uniref:PilZ domain-containing protein n=1 Tax=Aliiglaciecola litoralis TaxID=582857 RepID=A0ABN1LEW6_9ALTE
MTNDKRVHPRFSPKGVHADIIISNQSNPQGIHLEGNMLDMSYSGIRIKLLSAMPATLPDSHVKITLTLPTSGICCTIKGLIRHVNEAAELGLQYSKFHPEHEMDDFIFECVKHVDDVSGIVSSV